MNGTGLVAELVRTFGPTSSILLLVVYMLVRERRNGGNGKPAVLNGTKILAEKLDGIKDVLTLHLNIYSKSLGRIERKMEEHDERTRKVSGR